MAVSAWLSGFVSMPSCSKISPRCRSIRRLMTTPMVPSSECSQMSVTLRAKFASARFGMAIRKWLASEFVDANRGIVEDLLAGRAPDRDSVDAAVGIERHVEEQVPRQMASLCLAGIIEIADAFDLGAPGVHVDGEFIFLRARVQEPVPRTFLVLPPGAADLGVQARAFLKYFRPRHEPEIGRLQLQLFFVRLGVARLDFPGGVLGKQRGHFTFGRHALLRKGLERREVTVDRTDLAHR